MNTSIRGVIPAVPTPFSMDGTIHFDAFVEHAQWCLDNGCDALNVLGTTGEANSLSKAQRSALMEAAAQRLDRSRLMVGTGTPDLEASVALTRQASALGFAAALVLPPYYYKPVSEDGIFGWFEALIARTADQQIDIYLYNFPQLTGIEFSPGLAARLHATFPDRIKGAKDSSGNLDYARKLAGIRGFAVFPSNEVSLAEAGQSGFAGCISATVNVDPRLSAALWRDQGNAILKARVQAVRQGVAAHPLVGAVKYLVGRRSLNDAWNEVILPNLGIKSASARAQLDAIQDATRLAA